MVLTTNVASVSISHKKVLSETEAEARNLKHDERQKKFQLQRAMARPHGRINFV